jgi:hypothetical protein
MYVYDHVHKTYHGHEDVNDYEHVTEHEDVHDHMHEYVILRQYVPETKHPWGQNVVQKQNIPWTICLPGKTSAEQNILRTKSPRDKTSRGKSPRRQNIL